MQPASISATVGSTTIQSLTYGYGSAGANNGNILTIANGAATGRDQTYSYDNLNRLQQGYDTHWGETYTYDPWDNLYQRTQMSGHGGDNWLVTPDGSNHLSNLTYDAAGQVTADQFSNSYTYDPEGRILTANTGTYVYDGDGNRVKKTVSGTTTLYWPGAASGVVDESNSAATSFGKQVYVAGLQVWSEDTSGSGRFLFQDHLGSTRVTGDAAGTLHDDIDYLPFGEAYNNYGASASNNHYLFTGDEADPESSTNYAVNRNLSGSMGRFNRPDPYNGSYDPANPQTFNRYSYVLNNPLNMIDPSGLNGCTGYMSTYNSHTGGNYDIATASGCISAGGTYLDDSPNCIFAPSVFCTSPVVQQTTVTTNPTGPQSGTNITGLAGGPGGVNGISGATGSTGGGGTVGPIDRVAMKSCLNTFYGSKAGKTLNFFSIGSMLWGPDKLGSTLENVLGIGSKATAVAVAKGAGSATIQTAMSTTAAASGVNLSSRFVALRVEFMAKALAGPVLLAATTADLVAHAACANSGDSLANTMFLNQAANPSPIP